MSADLGPVAQMPGWCGDARSGTFVLQTLGLPDGYIPPSASLTPPTVSWWWLLLVVTGVWLVLVTLAYVLDVEGCRVEITNAVLSLVLLPVLAVVWVFTRLDVGVTRLSPGSLARFAQMRSADKDRPAWVFFVWKRGIIVVRKWELGDERPKTEQ